MCSWWPTAAINTTNEHSANKIRLASPGFKWFH